MKKYARALGLLISAGHPAHAADLPTLLLPQEQEVQLALEAGPEHLRADATV